MQTSTKRSVLVVLGFVMLATPALANDRAHHIKQSNPAYWNPEVQSDAGALATAKRSTAARADRLPMLPSPARPGAPVDYNDLEIMP